MALGTVVRDVYTNTERQAMHKTLRDLLPSGDWSKAGLYCYWNPENGEALYIGLSKDLPLRFAQHNSLRGKPGQGNKALEIDNWFQTHDRLGFSIVLQSALADDVYEGNTKLAEGQLIEGYRARHDKFPPWNKMSGSTDGHQYVGTDTAVWFDFMTGAADGLVVARRTIRELNDDATADLNEGRIHTSRTGMNHLTIDRKLDDTAILACLKDTVERDAQITPYLADLYDFEGLRDYLMQPAPHPEHPDASEIDDESAVRAD
ncbi:hypothetical protein [Rhodococcus sp. D-1]|uniref:hypothetical protein n=1 Tax=Rhodococcus sp. D-1 TaxID=1912238 RepID=UPI000975EC5E|nr:hypothetical protein [Rhodococcus sp. D-1]OMQ28576.1 hypothetical protein BK799_29645 [Rhodococcus sp. D-1]